MPAGSGRESEQELPRKRRAPSAPEHPFAGFPSTWDASGRGARRRTNFFPRVTCNKDDPQNTERTLQGTGKAPRSRITQKGRRCARGSTRNCRELCPANQISDQPWFGTVCALGENRDNATRAETSASRRAPSFEEKQPSYRPLMPPDGMGETLSPRGTPRCRSNMGRAIICQTMTPLQSPTPTPLQSSPPPSFSLPLPPDPPCSSQKIVGLEDPGTSRHRRTFRDSAELLLQGDGPAMGLEGFEEHGGKLLEGAPICDARRNLARGGGGRKAPIG